MPPTGDLARNPDMWPDWELNWRPFGSQAGAQSTESPSQGLFSYPEALSAGSNIWISSGSASADFHTNNQEHVPAASHYQ